MEAETSEGHDDLSMALTQFLETTTLEQAQGVLQQNPALLTDEVDLLLSSIIHTARQQGLEEAALGLDERRNFIRSVRLELEGKVNQIHH
jgi:hypothetical protein